MYVTVQKWNPEGVKLCKGSSITDKCNLNTCQIKDTVDKKFNISTGACRDPTEKPVEIPKVLGSLDLSLEIVNPDCSGCVWVAFVLRSIAVDSPGLSLT